VEWYGLTEKDERQARWKLLLSLSLLSLYNPSGSAAFLLFAWPGLFLFYAFLQEKWKIFGKIIFWLFLAFYIYSSLESFLRSQNWSSTESTWVITALPIAALLSLEWTRWWAMNSPRPLREVEP